MGSSASGEDSDLGVWGWVKSIVSWLVLLAVLAILALTIIIPRLTGATPYTVLTGSMEPTYPPGTLIVVKQEDPAALKAGDVITFQKESGKLAVVTHRIIEIRENARGEKSFVTQGDANPSRDMDPVVPEQIRGKLWYAVPYMGYVNSVVTGEQRSIMIIVVVGGLIAYAGWMFIGGLKDRKNKGKDEESADEPSAEPPKVEPAPKVEPDAAAPVAPPRPAAAPGYPPANPYPGHPPRPGYPPSGSRPVPDPSAEATAVIPVVRTPAAPASGFSALDLYPPAAPAAPSRPRFVEQDTVVIRRVPPVTP